MMMIVYIWLGTTLPNIYKETFNQCLKNYGNCVLLNDTHFEEEKSKRKYIMKERPPVQKSDLLRLWYLQTHGGIYIDLDSQIRDWDFIRSINCTDTWFGQEQWTLTGWGRLSPTNWFICTPPNTQRLKNVIANINESQTQNVFAYAGPAILARLNTPILVVYPHIIHCYHNSWIQIKDGVQQCRSYTQTPRERFDLMKKIIICLGVTVILLLIAIVAGLIYFKREKAKMVKVNREEAEEIELSVS